jgi:hypothetical protein
MFQIVKDFLSFLYNRLICIYLKYGGYRYNINNFLKNKPFDNMQTDSIVFYCLTNKNIYKFTLPSPETQPDK